MIGRMMGHIPQHSLVNSTSGLAASADFGCSELAGLYSSDEFKAVCVINIGCCCCMYVKWDVGRTEVIVGDWNVTGTGLLVCSWFVTEDGMRVTDDDGGLVGPRNSSKVDNVLCVVTTIMSTYTIHAVWVKNSLHFFCEFLRKGLEF